ncbi:MAG: nucleotide-binding protein [Vicinamibacterales bacterium]
MVHRALVAVLFLASAACGTGQTPAQAAGQAAAPPSSGVTPPAAAQASPHGAAGAVQTVSGEVVETIDSGGYTYARLRGPGGADTWVAAAEMPIEKGVTLAATVSVTMENFHSRTLNRDFPVVHFVSGVTLNGLAVASNAEAATVGRTPDPAQPMMSSHGAAGGSPQAGTDALIAPIPPAPGGLSVAQVWQQRASLSGKPIVVRGKVVKANYEIMGTNWYHVQDGSGALDAGTHDLTVTSPDRVGVGDVVTVSGPVSLDKDFGAGYAYDVIVEGARLTK